MRKKWEDRRSCSARMAAGDERLAREEETAVGLVGSGSAGSYICNMTE